MKPKKKKKQDAAVTRPSVVIPYVEKVSETVARIMKKYNVPCAMKPWVTLKNVLVHPKDREDKEQTTECGYKVPCASCEKTYIGETGTSGWKLGVRLQEHRSEVESKTNRAFTGSHRSSSSAESNRSALTDHSVQEYHVISWSAASVIDRESDRSTRWIKQGRSTIHEPGRRELPTQSYVRPLSWLDSNLSRQEPEEDLAPASSDEGL